MQWFYCLPKKTQWHLVQKGENLGYFVDLESGVTSALAVRMQKLKERKASLLDTGVTGTVTSFGLALGPVARLWTRSLLSSGKVVSVMGQKDTAHTRVHGRASFLEKLF